MKINTKKTTGKIILILISLAAVTLSLGLTPITDINNITSIEKETDRGCLLVCIDPGHGGTDKGAASPGGLLEKDVNLDIAVRIKSKLQNEGIDVIMTRTDDSLVTDEERVQIANESNADIFISIHNNSMSIEEISGTEVFYCESSPAVSRNFAGFIHDELINTLGTQSRGIKTGNFYILSNSHMVSALVNSMFISNPEEETKLKQREHRDQIAEAVKDGILKFISEYDVSSFEAAIDDLGNTPGSFLPGETRNIDIRITNNSQYFIWPSSGENPVSISYNVYNEYNAMVIFDGNRTTITERVGPGETIDLSLSVKAPRETGMYVLEYDLVQEGVVWFSSRGNATLKKNIIVTDDQEVQSTGSVSENTDSSDQTLEDQQAEETDGSPEEEDSEESASLNDLEEGEFGRQEAEETTDGGEDILQDEQDNGSGYSTMKIIFISDRDGGDWDLFMSDLDGSNMIRLTNNSVDDIYPTVSPDGTKIAFTSTINGLWQIMVMNRDGSGLRQITSTGTLNAYPAWSYDGKYIFYESKVGGVWEIYRIDADGTGNRRLTYNPSGDDWHPACHTGKSYLIYESGTPGRENIMIMDFNGNSKRAITSDGARNRTPDNSGFDETLVFTRYNGGEGQVFTMDIYGNNMAQITSMSGRNIHPTLSPDNKYIAFDSDGSGKLQLHIFSFEDGSIKKIINDPVHNYKDPFFLFY